MRRRLHAGELFSDRIDESTAFSLSLKAHRDHMSARAVGAMDDENRNVLVYYGLGGIGKTALSKRLQSWVSGTLPAGDEWGPLPEVSVVASSRIDLSQHEGHFDLLDAIVGIRAAFDAVKKPWSAFDLAFTAYWKAAYPNDNFPDTSAAEKSVSRAMADALVGLLGEAGFSGTLASLGVGALRKATSAIRQRSMRNQATDMFPDYSDLLERCLALPSPDDPRLDVLLELPHLLDYELNAATSDPRPVVVVFVDGFEKLKKDPVRLGERHLNDLMWWMPNVLFVVTGRDRLDWHSTDRTTVGFVGPARWPNLVNDLQQPDPRQHLVDYLSEQDTLRVIDATCRIHDLDMPTDVRQRLADQSGGLPQYLELARAKAVTAKANFARPITVDDVTGSLGDLVERVLSDIDPDEQAVIRAAALFPQFDAELVARTADTAIGAARRAMERPMIDRRGTPDYPYTMHDTVREALRSADHRVAHGWDDRDWHHAATRGLKEVRRRHDEAKRANDYPGVLTALGLAIHLVCEVDIDVEKPANEESGYADWLSEAVIFGPSLLGLRPLLPVVSETPYGQAYIDFVLARTYESDVDARCATLASVFARDHPLSRAAGRHRAYSYRYACRFEESFSAWDELIAIAPSPMHQYQRAFTLVTARRFRDALEQPLTPERTAMIRREVDFSHGRPFAWLEATRLEYEDLKTHQQREAIDKLSQFLSWSALLRGDVDLLSINRLRRDADEVGHSVGTRGALTAQAFVDPHSFEDRDLDYLGVLDRAQNLDQIDYRWVMVSAALAYLHRDRHKLVELQRAVNERSMVRGRWWIPVECLLEAEAVPVARVPAQWLEPRDEVVSRWTRVFADWANRVS